MTRATFFKLAFRCRNSPPAILWAAVLFAGCSSDGLSRDPQSSTNDSRVTATPRTALDEYVARPDTNYSYHLVTNFTGKGQTTFVLEMTSQAWLTTNEVDRPLWKHWLIIVKPDEVRRSKSLLFINGGANDGRHPKGADGNFVRIA